MKAYPIVVVMLAVTLISQGESLAKEPPPIERQSRFSGRAGWMVLHHDLSNSLCCGSMESLQMHGPTAGLRASYRFHSNLDLSFHFAAALGLTADDDTFPKVSKLRFYEVGGTLDVLLAREAFEFSLGFGGTAWLVEGEVSHGTDVETLHETGPAATAIVAGRMPFGERLWLGAEVTASSNFSTSSAGLVFTTTLHF
ncbi:MAG: hypothetical protein ACLFVJ_23090 [Persicimonas sp.]